MTEFNEELRRAKELAEVEPDESLRICSRIMNEDMDGPHGQMALFMTGYIMMQAERYGLAYQIYNRCAQLNPAVSEIYSNMGMCLEGSDPHKARQLFQKAYSIDPDNSHALANEALLCLQEGNPRGCLKLCNRALEIDPNLRAAQHNKSLALIMLRSWKEGWQLYFDTLGVKHREKRNYGLPEWNGQPGKVLVYGEQGVGDEIMFASCLPDLMKTNEVVIDTDSRLEALFRRSFDIPVYGTRFSKEAMWVSKELPDYQCAIGQLPRFYRSSEKDFPGTPYLKVDPDRSLMWRALFDSFPGRKIGIGWTGGLVNTGSKERSFELKDFSPMFGKDTFISLEYNDVDYNELDRYGVKYFDETKKGRSLDELAALVSGLDMVVTCCTAVLHICGSLGVPCYVLAPQAPPYIIGVEGDLPFYRSVKIRRKTGSWKSLIKKVKKEVDAKNLRRVG